MNGKFYLVLCLTLHLLGHHGIVKAQEILVRGKVTADAGESLPGVNVIFKGTSIGTTTDGDGNYSLNVSDAGSVLVFSFIGYQTQEIVPGKSTVLDVRMIADTETLDEIVIVGYGEVRKSDLTGSVSSVRNEEINAYPATNVMQSLAGRATGVQISQNTGAPGSAISVRVRGTNSIQGSNEPLYVVDGFPYSGNPTLLNNADIESVEILKDASATAIYGSRGANGVILITTKRGKSGKATVEYDGYVGFQSPRKTLDMMNAKEYAQFYNEQAANDAAPLRFTQEQIDAFGEGTDWQGEVLQTAPIHNHSLTFSGGNDKTQFSISGSNFNQEGIIIGSDYVRNSIRANINTDISDKFSLSFNSTFSRIDSDRQDSGGGNRGGTLIGAMISGYPTVEPVRPDGTYENLATIYPWGSNVMVNPLNFIYQSTDHIRANRILANAALTYKPIDGLTIKISGGIENNDDRTDAYTTRKFVNSTGSARIGTTQGTSLLNENIITYAKKIGEHNFSVLGGFTYQDFESTTVGASGTGFVSDIQETYDIGSATTLDVPTSSYQKWVLLSYLGRINYTYKEKYLATVSFRADGSSRYSEGSKWGYFPSGSLAWRLSQEPFLVNNNFISDLKIRVGYGESGSTAINPYQTLNQLVSGKVVFGDALYTAYAPDTRLPGDLKWETTSQTDFGIDFSILDNRFLFTADYYIKKTFDLLNNVPLPSSLGYTTTIDNVGEIENKGFEFSADANVLTGKFKWEVSANISFNKNKVVKLYGGKDVLSAPINITVVNDNISILREGEPLGMFYGYVEAGYDANGKIVYEDFNGNGVRDLDDKSIIGNPNPDFIYGFNSTMSFMNFELNVFFQGSQGNDIFNLSSVNQTLDYGFGLNMPREVFYNHWTPQNTDAKYPAISRTTQTQVSDRFVEDGSYLRMRNIQLGYNVPVSKLKIPWLSKAQIYVSGQNLLTATNYSWYDPEINSYGGSNSIRQGIDHYSYPTAKTYTVGMRLGF
jgi:TonB-linked SusC/RagA family outer membrane protein